MPGRTEYQDIAVEVGAKLPARTREMVGERAGYSVSGDWQAPTA